MLEFDENNEVHGHERLRDVGFRDGFPADSYDKSVDMLCDYDL